MKSLVQFINEQKYKLPSDHCNSFNSFLKNNNINEDELQECDVNWYFENVWDANYNIKKHKESSTRNFVWINEMLKSHNVDILIKELNKEFYPKYKTEISINDVSNSKSSNKAVSIKIPDKLRFDDNDWNTFNNIVDKFMWVVTSRGGLRTISVGRKRFKELEIEPIEGDNCTKYIKTECNSTIYHVTEKKFEEKIDSVGLRPRGEKRIERFYTNRIYFGTGNSKKEVVTCLKEIIKSLDYDPDNVVIYVIDISKMNIEFYRDPYDYPDVDAIYTFANIPPKFIKKKITFNEITA